MKSAVNSRGSIYTETEGSISLKYPLGAGSDDAWLLVTDSDGNNSTCDASVSFAGPVSVSFTESTNGIVRYDGHSTTVAYTAAGATATKGTDCDVVTLPIELNEFSAECTLSVVALHWSTAMEHGNSHFVIERSTDGERFEESGVVIGSGYSNSYKRYQFVDRDPPEGAIYYRLVQIDFNGQSKTYPVLHTNCNTYSLFNMHVDGATVNNYEIPIGLQSEPNEPILVVLTDILGQELYSISEINESGNLLLIIRPDFRLTPGIYFITASVRNQYISRKVIVK